MSLIRKVSYEDSWQVDPQERLRTSQQELILEAKYTVVSPVLGNNATGTASVTRSVQRASFLLATGGTPGDLAERQTRQRAIFQPGQGQSAKIEFVGYALAADVDAKVGLFDTNNGFFLQADGTTLYLVIRSDVSGSPVDTRYAQTAWEIPLDGTGGYPTLDFATAQTLIIDYDWGTGRIRFGFRIDGMVIVVLTVPWANVGTSQIIRNPNLPIRWEISSSGTTVRTLEALGGSVVSEGSNAVRGLSKPFDNGVTGVTASGGLETELVAIRLDNTSTPPGIEVGAGLVRSISVICTTGSNYIWRLRALTVGPTGGTWSSPSGSFIEYNTTRTGAVTGGVELDSGYVTDVDGQGVGAIDALLGLGYDIFTASAEIFSLTVQKIGPATSETFYGKIGVQQEG